MKNGAKVFFSFSDT